MAREARFCTECGTWVVHPATPPVVSQDAFASTLLASDQSSVAPPPDRPPARPTDRGEDPLPERFARTVADERSSSSPSLSSGRTPRPLGAFLVSYQYEPLGTFWPLAVGGNLVGRAGGRLDLDVGIADTTVSTEHAALEVQPQGVTVEDRGSTNGCFVNGRALPPRGRAPLRHGDRVCFGSFETIVVVVPYPLAAAKPAAPG